MTPARFIREHVFRVRSQTKFAEMLGYSQPHIWRWERGIDPIGRRAQERIRALAQELGVAWDDRWFFEVPAINGDAA